MSSKFSGEFTAFWKNAVNLQENISGGLILLIDNFQVMCKKISIANIQIFLVSILQISGISFAEIL